MKNLMLFIAALLTTTFITYSQSPWKQKSNMNTRRISHSTVMLNNKFYTMGGNNTNADQNFRSMEVYDPVTDSWTALSAEMVFPRAQFATCVVSGKIWALGGTWMYYFQVLNSVEAYDTVSNTWNLVTGMLVPKKVGYAVSLVESKIYIIGGGNEQFERLSGVEIYDTITKEWTTGADMPTPRLMLSSVVLDGKIYAIGGMTSPNEGEDGLTTLEVYDPETDTWTGKADMRFPRKYFTANVINGKIYVFGGATGYCTGIIREGEVYDPENDTWTLLCSVPQVVCKHSAVSFQEKIFLFGGESTVYCPDSAISTMYEYDPAVDLYPWIGDIQVDKSYTKPGTDNVIITTELRDTTGMTLYAVIQAPHGNTLDSLLLFDDGNHNDGDANDGLYSNTWSVSSKDEQDYFLDLQITRTGTDTIMHHMNNMAFFTTVGPVVFEGHDWVDKPEPGEKANFKISLRNHGSTASATGIEAGLTSLDTLVSIQEIYRTFVDIAPGEVQISKGNYSMQISENWEGTDIPIVADIFSHDHLFWTDTFFITVPDALPNIAEPCINIYPNPATNQLCIEFDKTASPITSVMLYDMTGQEIFSEFTDQRLSSPYIINLSSFEEGIYIINISNNQYSYTEKVIKVE